MVCLDWLTVWRTSIKHVIKMNLDKLVTWQRALVSRQVMMDRRVHGTNFRKKL